MAKFFPSPSSFKRVFLFNIEQRYVFVHRLNPAAEALKVIASRVIMKS